MLNKVENIYTSVACNRTSGALDWNKANQICFAAKHAVAIYEETNVCDSFLAFSTLSRLKNYWAWVILIFA